MGTMPQLILVMRHAEKPDDPLNTDLSAAGEARAQHLATYIPETFGDLDFIFAAANSKHSVRPVQTVKPLSKKTGIRINSTISDQDYSNLATELLSGSEFADKRILVCWHHGNIPSLMQLLRAPSGTYPSPWDATVFDLILQLRYPALECTVTTAAEPF